MLTRLPMAETGSRPGGKNYLLVTDYYSRYPEIVQLRSTTSSCIITACKSIFARYGTPELLISDNGPQFASQEFKDFAFAYNFEHKTSSPQYPQSNGQVERMVQTIKNLLKKSSDPYMALLSYRATPFLWCNLSPAELLMGRKVRTTLPQIKEHLVPQWQYPTQFRRRNKKFKQRQKMYYDRSHHTTQLPSLPNHTQVWVKQRIKWMKQQ